MLEKLKQALYFPLASYFAYFAKVRLNRWRPRVIVITGSSGKTTTLHLVESQIRGSVRYSHHANSAFGIPFDILNISRKTLRFGEWFGIFLKAPIQAFKKPYKEKIYIVEADADRPHEGEFLSKLLCPEVTVWLSSARTHSMNFDELVQHKNFKTVDEAIAYEFGNFLVQTSKMVILNGDTEYITKQISRTNASIEEIHKKDLKKYTVSEKGTTFLIGDKTISLPFLLPKDSYYSLRAAEILCEYLGISWNSSFQHFSLPPGRSSILKGKEGTVLIDSTYNANLSSMKAILTMFAELPAPRKGLVLGDMMEQGKEEEEEHEKLAEFISKMNVDYVILKGPRVSKYVFPQLQLKLPKIPVVSFLQLKEVYDYLEKNKKKGDIILFKGGQSMLLEGVLEKLLLKRDEARLLPRREKIWKERMAKQGL